MYVTAQRVVGPGGQSGVNVFRYRHGAHTPPGPQVWDGENLGELDLSIRQVEKPGGLVISFIDLVGPGETLGVVPNLSDYLDFAVVSEAFDVPQRMPMVFDVAGVDVRFYAIPDLRHRGGRTEFEALASQLRAAFGVLTVGARRRNEAQAPIVIRCSRRDGEHSFALDKESYVRLQRQQPLPRTAHVLVPADSATMLIAARGHDRYFTEIAALLMHASVADIVRIFGEVRILDADDHTIIWESRARR